MATYEIQVLEKQPSESRLYDVEFAALLRGSDTLASVVSVTVSPSSTTPALTVGSPTYSGTRAQFRVSAGKAETRYRFTVVVTSVGGDTLEFEGVLFVTEN